MSRLFDVMHAGDLRTWIYPWKKVGIIFLVLEVNSLGITILCDGKVTEGWNTNTILKWSVDIAVNKSKKT